MRRYDYVDKEIKNLIEKIKSQDYEAGKYLENNIVFNDEGIILSENEKYS